jgi:hypothetical protein
MGASCSVWKDGQTDMTELIVENHALLGYYSASNGNSFLKFRDNLSVSFQGILKDGSDLLSRNGGKELQLLAEKWHRKVQFLFATPPLFACVMNILKLIVVVSNFTNTP